jgi:hypothetical protein
LQSIMQWFIRLSVTLTKLIKYSNIVSIIASFYIIYFIISTVSLCCTSRQKSHKLANDRTNGRNAPTFSVAGCNIATFDLIWKSVNTLLYSFIHINMFFFLLDLFKNQLFLPQDFLLDLRFHPSLMSLLIFVTQW